MYLIYSGYVNCDNHDASEGPIYTLKECLKMEKVVELRKEYDESMERDDASNGIFRVFEAEELEAVPSIRYKLKRRDR